MADEKQSGSGFGGGNLILLAAAAASAVYLSWQTPPLVASRPSEAERQIHSPLGAQTVDARLWQDPFGPVAEAKNAKTSAHDNDASAATLPEKEHALVLAITLPGGRSPVAIEERRRLRYAVLAALHTEKYLPADTEHLGYVHIDGGNDMPSLRADVPFELFDRISEDRHPLPGADHDGGASARFDRAPGRTLVGFDRAPGARHFVPEGDHDDGAFERVDRAAEPRRVVVMWLDEGVFGQGRQPIERLKRLPTILGVMRSDQVVVLGPHDSTVLEAMMREIDHPDGGSGTESELAVNKVPPTSETLGQSDNPRPILTLYNFAATSEPGTLQSQTNPAADKCGHDGAKPRWVIEKARVRYYRTIAPDMVLACALAAELRRRRVDPGKFVQRRVEDDTKSVEVHPDHVALISEWDSVYGQTLPETMAGAFGSKAATSILRYSYLRGLDGRLPARRSSADEKASNESSEGGSADRREKADTARALDIGEGQGQFDYLRRLAERMRERDQELRRHGQGGIAAIGVLGSDVYDKLLILQALKPEFPGALFFTTDLDALLWTSSKSEYTRNLIVASGFDLRLRDELQGDIPPFRSAYQTSIFLSARLALQKFDYKGGRTEQMRAALRRWLGEPRLFEIGRSGPRALPATTEHTARLRDQGGEAGEAACRDNILECDTVMPQAASLFPTLKSGAFFSAGLLGAILLFGAALSSRTLRQLCFAQSAGAGASRHPAPSVWLIVVAGIALSASFALFASWPSLADFLTQHGMGEPMALFEGVSVWPTVLLRAASFILSLWLICHTVQSLGGNLRETEQEMHLRQPHFWFLKRPYPRGRGRSVIRRVIEAFSLAWLQGSVGLHDRSSGQGGRPRVPVFRLTVSYAYYGRTHWRLCRAGAATLAMFVLWWLLAPIFGELNSPIRGHVTGQVYMLVTIADVFATLFLTFLVADATLYSRSFVAQLAKIRSEWPSRTLEHFERKLGLDPAYLDDWIDIQFLVKRTKFITTLIYFPALMLALLVVSRSPVFDSYTVTPTLVISQLISVVAIIASVFSLRRTAERARGAAVEHLTDRIIAAKGTSGQERIAEQLQMLLTRVENLSEGAFAPMSSQPIVKAVLLPLLSYGATVLIQMYALPGT